MELRKPAARASGSNSDSRPKIVPALGKRLVRSSAPRVIAHCPHCHSEQVVKWGSKDGNRRFRCNQCERTFSILTNTELAHLRYRKRWISFIGAMVEEKSLREAAAICDVSLGTAQRWQHRLLGYAAQHGPLGLALLDALQELLPRI